MFRPPPRPPPPPPPTPTLPEKKNLLPTEREFATAQPRTRGLYGLDCTLSPALKRGAPLRAVDRKPRDKRAAPKKGARRVTLRSAQVSSGHVLPATTVRRPAIKRPTAGTLAETDALRGPVRAYLTHTWPEPGTAVVPSASSGSHRPPGGAPRIG